MRFLIDEDLPRSTGDLLRRYGHEAVDVRDIGIRGAKDSQIATYAQKKVMSCDRRLRFLRYSRLPSQ